jgi:hypothetical protein
MTGGGTRPTPSENNVGEVAVAATKAAVWAPVEESEAVTVTVVEEPEPWSGARRHGAEEAHILQAPLVEEPEKVAAVEAPDGAGTPVHSRHSVQVVAGPRVARVEAPEPHVARRGALWAPGPRVGRRGAPVTLGPRVACRRNQAHVRCDEWN